MRRFHDETSIIIGSGADVALVPLRTSEFGTGELNLDFKTLKGSESLQEE